MDRKLFDQIEDALDKRKDWADRQQTCYTMRNGGIRRTNKPYVNAPDGWYPLGDTMIETIKPLYIQQLYVSDTIASFISLTEQDDDMTSSAAAWLDYQLKQRSNFELTYYIAVDQALEQAFSPVKCYYDAKLKQLAFDQVDPLHLIVPSSCQEYNKNGGTDWMVHILHLTVAEYNANPNFDHSTGKVTEIKGRGHDDAADKDQDREYREGITGSSDDNEVILWEIYHRDRLNKSITVETVSPLLECENDANQVRAPFQLPFNKGIFKGGETFPFFKLRAEIKGKGHYSSRGLIEINAPFERSLTRDWNRLHEHMDFSCNPNFENTGGYSITSSNNFKNAPGSVLPQGLKLAIHPPVPSSIRENMEMTRGIAENRTKVPDLGLGQHLDPNTSKNATATQINAVMGQSNQGNDMRARILRLDLGEGLQMAWGIALQYLVTQVDENGQPDQRSLKFLVDGVIRSLDPDAAHDDYEITPNGSADSWNKGAQVAQRAALYQQLFENPYIKKDELTKWYIEAIDSTLVKRIYQDPQVQAATQAEDQAMECLLIAAGTSPVVQESDDDKTHLTLLAQFVQDKIQRIEMTPEMAGLSLKHGGEHMQALQQKRDPALAEVRQQLKPLVDILMHIAQQPGPPPKNILPMEPNLQQQSQQVQQPTPSAMPVEPAASLSVPNQ